MFIIGSYSYLIDCYPGVAYGMALFLITLFLVLLIINLYVAIDKTVDWNFDYVRREDKIYHLLVRLFIRM